MTPRLALTADGDLDFTTKLRLETDPVKNISGKIRKVLMLFQGSWFLAAADGVPWFQRILSIKNPNLRLVQQILRAAVIKGVPEIVELPVFTLAFNRKARTLAVSFQAVTNAGLAQGTITVP